MFCCVALEMIELLPGNQKKEFATILIFSFRKMIDVPTMNPALQIFRYRRILQKQHTV